MDGKGPPEQRGNLEDPKVVKLQVSAAVVRIVEITAGTFGLPGFMVACVLFFAWFGSSVQQRHEIVDKYILGKDLTVTPLVLLVVLYILVFLAQRHYYTKGMRGKDGEISRLSSELDNLRRIQRGGTAQS